MSVGASITLTVVVGNPKAKSRTWAAAMSVADRIGAAVGPGGRAVTNRVVDLAEIASRMFGFPDSAVDEAVQTAISADLLVVASPTYKAAYTGLLKAFCDRFAPGALAGVVAVPVMVGASAHHALVVETAMRPLLVEMGASCPTRGLYIVESDFAILDRTVDAWMDGARPVLVRALSEGGAPD